MKLLLLALIVGGCLVASNPVEKRVDNQPLGSVGSALHLPDLVTTTATITTEPRIICLEISRELSNEWPVLDVVSDWNKNGLNLFTTELTTECDGTVLVSQSDTKQWWGDTEFYARDLVHVEFSTTAPHDRYHAIVCHELGHVFGLPHSSGDGSCMDPAHNNPEPTPKDLTTISQEPWNSSVARNKINGVR